MRLNQHDPAPFVGAEYFIARIEAAQHRTGCVVENDENGDLLGLWIEESAIALVELDYDDLCGTVDRLMGVWHAQSAALGDGGCEH